MIQKYIPPGGLELTQMEPNFLVLLRRFLVLQVHQMINTGINDNMKIDLHLVNLVLSNLPNCININLRFNLFIYYITNQVKIKMDII